MEYLQALVLGLLQGITEFLPISSSGHLYLTRSLLGWEGLGTDFDAAIHLGTLTATFLVFFPEIKDTLKKSGFANLIKIGIATIPALAIGFLFQDFFDSIKSEILTAFMLILLGVAFLFVPKDKSEKDTKDAELPEFKKLLAVGTSQILAFISGTSRSGVTLLTGKVLNLDFRQALYTSFLLSIPIIAAAGLWGAFSEFTSGTKVDPLYFIVGLVSSFVSGFIAAKFLKDKLPLIGLRPFGIYRIALGLLIILIQIIN